MATSVPSSSGRLTRLLIVLSALFFLSGTSALIYQVLWLRLLGLVFGVTVYAASTVWAVFMAGLAIGSFLGGRSARASASSMRRTPPAPSPAACSPASSSFRVSGSRRHS